jgi:hypothetical protein
MPIESSKIGPGDPRYLAVVDKRFNKRFRGSPDYVRLPGSADQVAAAVADAVREGRRPAATREDSDPQRELWWAHTGGGGGNFGIVTWYWFRSPGASGHDPARLLPPAPASVTTFRAEWSWSGIDRASFLRLLQNHGACCERHRGADSPYASLWALLEAHRRQFGKIIVRGVSSAGPAAERQIDDHLAALGEGVGAPAGRELAHLPWLDFALDPFPDLFAAPPGGVRVKAKDALLKRRLTDRQIGVVYDHLTRDDRDVMGGMFALATYGGRVNTVAPDATASAATCSRTPAACPSRASPTTARSSTIRTPTSRTPRSTPRACPGPRSTTRATTRGCSASRLDGTRATCSGTRSRSGRGDGRAA